MTCAVRSFNNCCSYSVFCRKVRSFNRLCVTSRRYISQSQNGRAFHLKAPEEYTAWNRNIPHYPAGPSLIDTDVLFNKATLLQWSCDNIVHEDDVIVAVNKISGTPVFGNPSHVSGKFNPPTEGYPVSLISILPELCNRLQCEELDIALSLPRNHSGIVILVKSREIKKRLEKCVKTAETHKTGYLSYLAVTSGIPSKLPDGQEEMHFSKGKIGDRLLTDVVTTSSNKARQKGEEILAVFESRLLQVNSRLNTSLLEVKANKTKWECIEVYTTEKLASILGDHTYSARVSTIMGVPVHVQAHLATPKTQNLSKNLQKKLGIHDNDLDHLPLHLHRHRLKLTAFPTRQAPPLVIEAPVPDYFAASLHKLGLLPDNSTTGSYIS